MNAFKPGDVALVRNQWGVWNVAICSLTRGLRGFVWKYGVSDAMDGVDDPAREARPLVVIDPEDSEAVARLVKVMEAEAGGAAALEGYPLIDMTRVLREFANPKPRVCPAVLVIGGERIECERDPGHVTDHRNDSIGQGVRWS